MPVRIITQLVRVVPCDCGFCILVVLPLLIITGLPAYPRCVCRTVCHDPGVRFRGLPQFLLIVVVTPLLFARFAHPTLSPPHYRTHVPRCIAPLLLPRYVGLCFFACKTRVLCGLVTPPCSFSRVPAVLLCVTSLLTTLFFCSCYCVTGCPFVLRVLHRC